jgi:crossover junction endodeoxyribonuclease RusA
MSKEVFTLPFPPTLNTMYPTNKQGRRYTSKRGVDFKKDVANLMLVLKPRRFTGELKVELRFFRPKKIGDVDNLAKGVLDALKGHCYADDKQIIELHLYRFDDKTNPRAEVEISEV